MPSELVKMGEEQGRKTPAVVVSVRDNGTQLLQQEIIKNLELVTTNEVDDKEEIEGICGRVLIAAYLLLRALEQVGAQTRPDYELESMLASRRVRIPNGQRVPA